MATDYDYTPPEEPTEPPVEDAPLVDQAEQAVDVDSSQVSAQPRVSVKRQRRLPRLNLPALAMALALVALGVFAILLNRGQLPPNVLLWWPAVVVIAAAVWLLGSMARRDTAGLLGAAALLGVSISLLLATAYQVPLGATLVGVAFISIGMAIVIRGLLFRPSSSR